MLGKFCCWLGFHKWERKKKKDDRPAVISFVDMKNVTTTFEITGDWFIWNECKRCGKTDREVW